MRVNVKVKAGERACKHSAHINKFLQDFSACALSLSFPVFCVPALRACVFLRACLRACLSVARTHTHTYEYTHAHTLQYLLPFAKVRETVYDGYVSSCLFCLVTVAQVLSRSELPSLIAVTSMLAIF